MLLSRLLVSAFAFTAGEAFTFNSNEKTPKVVEGAYIVQLKANDLLSTRSNQARAAHEDFHKEAASQLDYTVRRQYAKSELFYGLSIDVQANDTKATIEAKLKAINGVEKVWPVVEYERLAPEGKRRRCVPRPKSSSTSTVSSTTSLASSTISSATATSTISSVLPKVTGSSDVLSFLEMSDIDKLHALGIKGKGVKIGIIDTGVDYRHPSLGGGFGSGYKIAGGYAYRDDSGNSVSIADPLATCMAGGHGTHVAGIIGMEDPEYMGFGLVGVAPEAEIYMYRVFGCTDSATTDDILAAMEQAHTDGVDLISLSLGSVEYWQWADPFAAMSTALVAEGIAVIAAAGNDGENGLFTPSSPGIGTDVISIGSIENTQFPVVYTALDSEGTNISYASIWALDSPSTGRDVYVLEGSGCDASEWIAAAQAVTDPEETIIVFYNNGSECDFTDKEAFWAKYDFNYIMDYTRTLSSPYDNQYVLLEQTDESTIYSNLLSSDGAALVANYAKAGGYPNYKLMFTDDSVSSAMMETGGKTSYFSSFGPTWDTLELKPQFSAPGATILSTWPLGFRGGYAALRGTSMATPFAAGSYALVKSQFPNYSIQEIRGLLQSTSTPVSSAYYPSILATTVQQGAGLINPYKAITFNTTISPTHFELGDTDDFSGKLFNLTITNNAAVTQTYTITHNGAALMEYLPFGVHPFQVQQALWDTQPESATYARVSLTSTKVPIPRGQSVTVFFRVTPPSDIDESKVPIMSGFISVATSTEQTFTIPYVGLPYSRRDAKYIDQSNLTVSSTGPAVPWPVIWTYNEDNGNFTYYNGSGIQVLDKKPIIINELEVGPLVNVLQPTYLCRADLLAANTTFKPTYYGYDNTVEWNYVLTTETYRNVLQDGVTPTYGLIGGYLPYRPAMILLDWENLAVISPNDAFEDSGGLAPTSVGDYRVLVSVLKWGGNFTDLTDWETWLSPIIRVIDGGLPNYGLPPGTPML